MIARYSKLENELESQIGIIRYYFFIVSGSMRCEHIDLYADRQWTKPVH